MPPFYNCTEHRIELKVGGGRTHSRSGSHSTDTRSTCSEEAPESDCRVPVQGLARRYTSRRFGPVKKRQRISQAGRPSWR